MTALLHILTELVHQRKGGKGKHSHGQQVTLRSTFTGRNDLTTNVQAGFMSMCLLGQAQYLGNYGGYVD